MKKLFRNIFVFLAVFGFSTFSFAQSDYQSYFDFDHIIYGEINSNNTLVGGHSILGVDVVETYGRNSGYKPYIAIIKKCNSDYCYTKNCYHTMFPDNWSEAKIKQEVAYAWTHSKNCRTDYNKWCGYTSNNIRIEGYVKPRRTAYPVVKTIFNTCNN